MDEFDDILAGRSAGHVFYEDDDTFAFLDVEGATFGHAVVVSRAEGDRVYDLPLDQYLALAEPAQRVAVALDAEADKARIVMLAGGFGVARPHIHLIPADNLREILGREAVDDDERERLAQRLRQMLMG